MNVQLGKTAFTPSEIDDLRDRLKALKAAEGLSWPELAKITGVPVGTISAWVPGTYNNGKIDETHGIAGQVYRFFQSRAEQAEIEATMPVEPDFIQTTTSVRMMKCLAIAHGGDMALISTAPGVGKSATVKQYAATRGNVFVVTVSPAVRGVNTMLIATLAAMGEPGAKGTPQQLSARIRARVRGASALIIVDEAQHLSPQALDELRSIHDDTDCGVALVGDETLLVTLKKFHQLYSRLGVRHTQPRPLTEDITAIAAGWSVTRGPELAFLHEIARKSGGIRTLTKTMKLAVRGARAGGAPLEVADLRDAYAQRYGDAA